MNDQNMTVLTNIIGAVESGGQEYGKRRYNDYTAPYTNSRAEHTITLGWAQNYGNEGRKLLQMIYDRNPDTFEAIDTSGRITAMLKKDWERCRWNPSAAEKKAIITLIDSRDGHICQDELFQMLMRTFIADCEKTYTKSVPAVMMYCEIRHLGGQSSAKRIFDRLDDDFSLDGIMASLARDQRDARSDNQVGDACFWSRHVKCRTFIERYAVEESEEGRRTDKGRNAMTKKEAIQLLDNIATKEVGYLEKKSISNLDNKTANAGSANYTKYWRDVYPEYQGEAWCACFVSWCFMKAFGRNTAEKMLKHWPFVYCPTLAEMTSNRKPEAGSIVLFYRNGRYAHTGIVTRVNESKIMTIEGNTSSAEGIVPNGGGVFIKTYTIDSLSGNTKYFLPDYSLVSDAKGPADSKEESGAKDEYIVGSGTVTLKHFVIGAKDPQIKTIQRLLNSLGYRDEDGNKLPLDGHLGESTAYAVAAFQKKAGMNPESPGTIATTTWKKILGAE